MSQAFDINKAFPSDQIRFVPETHEYFLGDRKLQSVTSLVKTIVPAFDRERISARSAAKAGVSQAEMLAEWDRKAQAAREKGTRVHACIDDVLNGVHDNVLASMNNLPEVAAFDEVWLKLRKSLKATILAKEKIIWHEGLGIAGRIDILLEVDSGCPNRIPCLFDWKTGKFATDNRYEKLLPPFEDLDNCELNVYSLQTSLYRMIIESRGAKLGNSYLVHLSEFGTHFLHRGRDLRERIYGWLSKDNPSQDGWDNW